jgi:hypothetical protein
VYLPVNAEVAPVARAPANVAVLATERNGTEAAEIRTKKRA